MKRLHLPWSEFLLLTPTPHLPRQEEIEDEESVTIWQVDNNFDTCYLNNIWEAL